MTSQKHDMRVDLNELYDALDVAHQDVAKQRGVYQVNGDLDSGLFKKPSGLLVQYKPEEFIHDNYDLFLINTYCELFKAALNAEDETFVIMSLRTLQDLGTKLIPIFFADQITKEEQERLRLIFSLCDLALVSSNSSLNEFKKLFDSKIKLLDEKALKHLQKIRLSLENSVDRVPHSLLRPASSYRDNLVREFTQNVKAPSFIKPDSLKMLGTYWSELLHGNPFVLQQLFSTNDRIRSSRKNRLRAILWSTGQGVLSCLSPLVKDAATKKLASSVLDRNEIVWSWFTTQWKEDDDRRQS